MVLHAAGLAVLVYCFGEAVNFNLFLMLLSGTPGDIVNSITNSTIVLAVFYLICLYSIAFGIGAVSRWSIKKYRLDRYHFFRIDSPWYYLFKGEGQADGVKIAATMEIAGNSFLYVGVLENFFINKEGNIDRLVLVSASRRHLKNDKGTLSESERFYPIDGHYFVLKYDEIKNLNVEYFDAIKDQDKITIQYVMPKE
jgi:hypothetical protein